MVKITTNIKITNLFDLLDFSRGLIEKHNIRTIYIEDAIVDTGATLLSISKDYINILGLERLRTVKVNTADNIVERGIYGPASIEINGRIAEQNVMELNHPSIKILVGLFPSLLSSLILS